MKSFISNNHFDKDKTMNYYNKMCFSKKISEIFSNITERKIECENEYKESSKFIKKIELLKFKKFLLRNKVKKNDNTTIKSSSKPLDSFFKFTKINSERNLSLKHMKINQINNSHLSRNLKHKKTIYQPNENKSDSKEETKDKVTIPKLSFQESKELKKKFRVKNYKIEYIKEWEVNEGFLKHYEDNKNLLNDIQYQKHIITNEIEIILNSFSHFQLYLKEIINQINKEIINERFIQKLNIRIETTIALLIEINNIILNEYESYIYKSELVKPIYPRFNNGSSVINEKKEFLNNINIFKECIHFLKCTYNIYNSLTLLTQNYIIPYKKMVKLKQFLSRGRYGIGGIIFTIKQYLKEIIFTDNLFNYYMNSKQNDIITFSSFQKKNGIKKSESVLNLFSEKVNRLEHLFRCKSDRNLTKKNKNVFHYDIKQIKKNNYQKCFK